MWNFESERGGEHMLASPETRGDQPLQMVDHMQQSIQQLAPQIYFDPKVPIAQSVNVQ